MACLAVEPTVRSLVSKVWHGERRSPSITQDSRGFSDKNNRSSGCFYLASLSSTPSKISRQ